MRRFLLLASATLLLASCASTGLYNWGGGSFASTSDYENLAYRYYDKQTPESVCALIAMYENVVSKPGGSRQVPPPGVCAEYGYLLLMPETAATFAEHATSSQRRAFKGSDFGVLFHERGIEMLKREIELYPESATFITPLLKKF